jgi:hypothetical protein
MFLIRHLFEFVRKLLVLSNRAIKLFGWCKDCCVIPDFMTLDPTAACCRFIQRTLPLLAWQGWGSSFDKGLLFQNKSGDLNSLRTGLEEHL